MSVTYPVLAAEDGYEIGPGLWDSTRLFMDLKKNEGNYGGIRIQIHNSFDPLGRPLDPPTLTRFTLNNQDSAGFGKVNVYLLNVVAPEQWSTANLPSSQVSKFVLVGQIVKGHDSVDMDLSAIFPLIRSSSWNGWLAFALARPGGIFTQTMSTAESGGGIFFTADVLPFITGIEGHVKAMSRIDRCPRCGKLMPREKFTLDGYTKGLYVCQKCWDPEDPPTRPIPPDAPPIND